MPPTHALMNLMGVFRLQRRLISAHANLNNNGDKVAAMSNMSR